MFTRTLSILCLITLPLGPAMSDDAEPMTEAKAVELVRTYCIDCHRADEPEARAAASAAAALRGVGRRRDCPDRCHVVCAGAIRRQ